MTEIRIKLPLPSRALSPNSRVHWRKKGKETQTARMIARAATAKALAPLPRDFRFEVLGYRLVFMWPDRRRRDDDNAAASCKAYRDGVADALGIDDSGLRMKEVPVMAVDREDPGLFFDIFLRECDEKRTK